MSDRPRRSARPCRGLTLIELLVVLALIAVLSSRSDAILTTVAQAHCVVRSLPS
jgi:prepilin-type N-terminal cleavage/methylation domain-containing protein